MLLSPMTIDPQLSQILYSAMESPLGLLIRSSDWRELRTKLYTTRRRLQIPELEQLEFLESWLPDGDLIILQSKSGAPNVNS